MTEEEEIQPLEFPFNIEEDIFQNFGNTSMYPHEKRPPVPKDPLDPLDKASLKETIKGLTAVMNSEWVHKRGNVTRSNSNSNTLVHPSLFYPRNCYLSSL